MDSFIAISLKDLEGFILSMFPEEGDLKEALVSSIENIIINTNVDFIEKPDTNTWILCFTSTSRLLTWYIKKLYSQVSFARRQATANVRVSIISAMMTIFLLKKLCLTVHNGQYLLTGGNWPDQIGHNDLHD